MELPRTPNTPARHPRRRRPVLALLPAAIIAAVIATGCGPATTDVASLDTEEGTGVDVPLEEDAPSDEATDAPDAPSDTTPSDGPADTAGSEPASEDDADDHTTTLTVGFDEDEITVFATDASEVASFGLPDGRLDRVADVVVRPGTTATELDAVVVVLRGEVYRLYHLGVTDGRDAVFTAFADHLQPQDVTEAVMTVTWTPDADSLAWTEPTGDGAVLRTVGWDGGPGTDRPADDNATFVLDLPADVSIDGFEVITDGRWTIRMTDGLGTPHTVEMERQPDGALALPS